MININENHLGKGCKSLSNTYNYQSLKNRYRKPAFTLVELIIAIVILAILGTIAFISLQGYSGTARDAKRKSDLRSIAKSLEFYKIENTDFPLPDMYKTQTGWTVGTFGTGVYAKVKKLNILPTDPKNKLNYRYELSENKKSFRVIARLETGKDFVIKGGNKADILNNSQNIPTNSLPILTGFSGDSIVYSEIKFLVTAQVSDADGDTVSISSSNLPTGVSISGLDISGSVATPGTYNFDLILNDGNDTTTVNVPLTITKMPKSPGCSSNQSYGSANYDSNGWIGFDSSGNYSDNGVIGVYVKNYKNYRLSEITNIINTKLGNGNYMQMSFGPSPASGINYSSTCYIDNNDIW